MTSSMDDNPSSLAPDEDDTIYELAGTCEQLLFESREMPYTQEANAKVLYDEYCQRFTSWTDFLGVFAKRSLSLDRRLQHHPHLRDLVLRLLEIMYTNLARWIACAEKPKEQSSLGLPHDAGDQTAQSDILEGIGSSIDRLHRLGTAIKQSSTRRTMARSSSTVQDFDSFKELALTCLKTLYPDTNDELLELLSMSMTKRYDSLASRRSRHQVLQQRRPRPKSPLLVIQEDKDATTQPRLAKQKQPIRSHDNHQTLLEKLATISTRPADLQSSPSSINTHIFNKRYKEMSHLGVNKKATPSVLFNKVGYPEPPQGYTCDWCYESLDKRSCEGNEWKRHMDRDLMPYICISDPCSEREVAFATYHEWHHHMLDEHGPHWDQDLYPPTSWLCPICSTHPSGFRHPKALFQHIQGVHDFEEAAIKAVVQQCKFRVRRSQQICPICCFPLQDDDRSITTTTSIPKKRQESATLQSASSKRVRTGLSLGNRLAKRALGANIDDFYPDRKTTEIDAMTKHVATHLQNLAILGINLSLLRKYGDDDVDALATPNPSESGRESSDNSTRKFELDNHSTGEEDILKTALSTPSPSCAEQDAVGSILLTQEEVDWTMVNGTTEQQEQWPPPSLLRFLQKTPNINSEPEPREPNSSERDELDCDDKVMGVSFSDLSELSAQPIPRRLPPPIPSPYSLQVRSLARPRENSLLSIESQQYKTLPHSANSSRTSLGAIEHRLRKHVHIGIDFGTMFSGVSWAISGSQAIHTINKWPDGDQVKVPTVVAYEPNGAIQWGYAVSLQLEQVKWFKLLLVENQLPEAVKKSHHLLATKAALKRLGKTAEDVTADYLQRLWEYALSAIQREISNSIDGMSFRVVVGMPADWPSDSQEKMRKAATKAGILGRRFGMKTTLEYVAEPEAAVVAAFYEGNIQYAVEIGDLVMICDAGGQTTDIATYEVTQLKPSVTLSESISGNTALCGSAFLDVNFMNFIEGLIGKNKLERLPRRDIEELTDTWEHKIKPRYRADRPEITVRVPHSVAKAVGQRFTRLFRKSSEIKQMNGDLLCITSAEMQAIFDPVINEILKLSLLHRDTVTKKRFKVPKAILLVGGLGGNGYLYERMQACLGNISVLQSAGPNVWASSSRGAAIKSMVNDEFSDNGAFPLVNTYISRAHYGMAFKEPFDSSRHTSEDRIEYDELEQTNLAWDQMSWYIQKGDDVSKGDPVEMSWEFKQPEGRSRKDYTVTIFECTAKDAPTRKTSDVHECAAITFTAAGESVVYQDGKEGRQQCRVVRFDLRMSLRGMGKVDFALYLNGKMAASRDVRVLIGGGRHRGRS